MERYSDEECQRLLEEIPGIAWNVVSLTTASIKATKALRCHERKLARLQASTVPEDRCIAAERCVAEGCINESDTIMRAHFAAKLRSRQAAAERKLSAASSKTLSLEEAAVKAKKLLKEAEGVFAKHVMKYDRLASMQGRHENVCDGDSH